MVDNRYKRDLETKYIGMIDAKEDIWYVELWHDVSVNTGKKFNYRLKLLDNSFTPRYTHKIDDCFSLDENLQQLVEKAGILI